MGLLNDRLLLRFDNYLRQGNRLVAGQRRGALIDLPGGDAGSARVRPADCGLYRAMALCGHTPHWSQEPGKVRLAEPNPPSTSTRPTFRKIPPSRRSWMSVASIMMTSSNGAGAVSRSYASSGELPRWPTPRHFGCGGGCATHPRSRPWEMSRPR